MTDEAPAAPADESPAGISLDAARRSKPTVAEPDAKAKNEDSMYAHHQATQKVSLGWIGRVLGSTSEKPGNVAAIVILFCFLMIGYSYASTDFNTGSENFFKLLAAMLGPVGLALGYLFGSSKKD